MKKGQIIDIIDPVLAFDDYNNSYSLHGSALVLDVNEFDATLLCTGKVLYTHTGTLGESLAC
mgnify:CR=1 FL=1